MFARIALVFTCILMFSGCGDSTTSTTSAPSDTAAPHDAAPEVSTSTTDIGNATAPIATLLDKPVYRSDCLSRSSGVGSVEVGIHSLVLGALIKDFCDREAVTLSDEEIDAFWKRMQSSARRNSINFAEMPTFDEARVQAKLDETRGKLGATNVSWLERLTLQAQEQAALYALEHKSVPATMAYENLMPLRGKAALYRK